MQPIVIDVEAIAIRDVDTYLEPVSAPDNYKKPKAIAAYLADARAKAIERAALDVDLAQIICIGLRLPGYATRVVSARTMSEPDMVALVWEEFAHHAGTFVTYNGLGYDVPMLLRRSLYLGVKAPYVACDRFRHPEVVDLMALLSMDGKLKAHGLQFYLNRFGYPKAGPDISGADVAARYAAGDWDAIEQHCRLDVEATAWLAERIGAVSKAVPVGQIAGAF